MHQTRGLFLQSLLLIWLGLAYRLATAQSVSCPRITIDDLGSTTTFSSNGLVSRGLIPPGEASVNIPVRIRNFTKVCDAAGARLNTSSFVSVVVEFQCDFPNSIPSLAVCNRSTIVTRQYQFQCIELLNGQPIWGALVSGSNVFVQTLNPTATLSTPLADQCRRCIDDQQSSRADPTTHCDRESIIYGIDNNYNIILFHSSCLIIKLIMCPQRVQHNVTGDRDVAILGK